MDTENWNFNFDNEWEILNFLGRFGVVRHVPYSKELLLDMPGNNLILPFADLSSVEELKKASNREQLERMVVLLAEKLFTRCYEIKYG